MKIQILMLFFLFDLVLEARAEILQIFQLLLWRIHDFINSFRLNLTFSRFCAKFKVQKSMVRGIWQQNIDVTWYFSTTLELQELRTLFPPSGSRDWRIITVDGVTPPIYCLTQIWSVLTPKPYLVSVRSQSFYLGGLKLIRFLGKTEGDVKSLLSRSIESYSFWGI